MVAIFPLSSHPSFNLIHSLIYHHNQSSVHFQTQAPTPFSFLLALHIFFLTHFFTVLVQTERLDHLSSHPHFLCSTYLPVCSSLSLYASASIESPSVPIHHALHFSLLAGINHKYFIIHHGRLSPAHPQFITAALSAGLPRRL